MSRKNKNKNQQNEMNEPWEQPIYDTEGEENYSRSAKRNSKKSNTTFLTIVLILIFLIVAIPIGTGAWVLFQKNKPETASTIESTIESSSSTIESTTTKETESSSTESSTSISSETQESTQSSEQPVTPPVVEPETPTVPATPETPTTPENAEGDYIEVLAGEGPNNVAARAGISVDELYRLNGMTADNFFLTPGQQLRIR